MTKLQENQPIVEKTHETNGTTGPELTLTEEMATQIEQQLAENTLTSDSAESAKPAEPKKTEEPADQMREQTSLFPIWDSWMKQTQAFYDIQSEMEAWTLQFAEQQKMMAQQSLEQAQQQWKQLSSCLQASFSYSPLAKDWVTVDWHQGTDWWTALQNQWETAAQTWMDQNRQTREQAQSLVETSANYMRSVQQVLNKQ